MWPDMFSPPNDSPMLVVLNYSGGSQSHCIARMLLRGEIKRPKCPLIVVAADPGNEHVLSYSFRDKTFSELRAAGIPAIVADGPKMLDDLRRRRAECRTSIDQPALWTESGGQLAQHCTRHYKIRPMNRAVAHWIRINLQISRWGTHSVERWIGFAFDETKRAAKMKMDDHRQQARFPLIDMQWTRDDVDDWYESTGEPQPPRSVCNHCWANGVQTFKRIHDTDPEGWQRAVEYDELAADMSQFGVRERTFCSRTRMRLKQLADNGFDVTGSNADAMACDSGVCFT
jgi:3'-phosphoadenosine 5'-phosphosulfate sulfotransferase (PAPS reductase)/FAD synthetase